jgi:hypothetical protein
MATARPVCGSSLSSWSRDDPEHRAFSIAAGEWRLIFTPRIHE